MFWEKVGFQIDLKEERVGFRTVFDRVMQFISNLGSRARETAEAMLFPVATLHLEDTGPLGKNTADIYYAQGLKVFIPC